MMMQQRTLEALEKVIDVNRALVENNKGARRGGGEDSYQQSDQIQALAGLEFKYNLPVIKDTDMDLERHIREYQSVLDCHATNKKGVRAYDRLTVFRKTLAPGSVRLKVYDTAISRARKMGRLPAAAETVSWV